MSDMSHAAVAADAGRLDRSPASGSSAVDSALSTPDSLLEVASVVSSLSGEAYGKQYSTESSLSFASAVDEFDFSPERVVMATLDSDAPHPSVKRKLGVAGRASEVEVEVAPCAEGEVGALLCNEEQASALRRDRGEASVLRCAEEEVRVLRRDGGEESIMDAVKDFSMYIPDFMEMISSLRLVGLPPKINTCDTLLGAGENIEVQFIAKAIASHMQTFGCTVVIGQNAQTVNEMINTLGIFLLPEERQCSRYVLEDSLWPYHPSLFLQGLLMERQGETNISARDVLCSRYPTTVVDVTTSEVRQSPPLHEHVHRRCDALAQEIHCIWTGKREDELYPTVGVFQPVDYPDTLVQNFLYELFQLSGSNGVRETYIQNFIRLLSRKALALIKYVETHTNFGRDPLKTSMRKLKHDLDLGQEGDFRIVLAQAEKLKPGFFCFLIGNSKLFAEPVYDI
ncbi:PREDICTED: protein C9orf72-like [Priapulus caudatus]|uniref:Protein C9orf72-like n=1 Tax=Priapulus caudatus TaxID=37621 RepID=A0ABM1EIY0_PRICU|nr:PREDICTED: protein C9orf72-like [Priapulus caudatus]XP_014672149.1 PREDICTED: protein C9orf72-like [Priapulus caudatus]XP_014672150.1 PREDICTED: protein C9orf72-like [Priapulus caudatus]XP_014672151.1 PREDICTED: protein C9orf72-like [Priapulus caudatus]XP_014672152.1 PREDICTED: protein C9orf72-like [Priapulus caudatus]XP_014672153.1 PREDICTED: protein C9orf72-like [Priapulus caudatus]XP_014672155.1 PREDICTED: protein C9orf72-like [Priapulus caudatus]